jgi:CelD/BcsL family acetyltransferase involved in cellulose biosynthesis
MAPRVHDSTVGLEPVETLADLPIAWAELAPAQGNIFATREWLQTWWRHNGDGRKLLAGAVRAEGCVVAILTLYRWSAGPFRVVRFLGHPGAGLLGPICAPEDVASAAAVCGSSSRPRGTTSSSPRTSTAGRTGGASSTHPSGAIAQPPSSTLTSRPGRTTSRRGARTSGRTSAGSSASSPGRTASATRLGTSDRLTADLDLFFDLHRRRWHGETPFSRTEAFHRDFARLASERGWLRLWFLELGGTAAAAWYGFRFGGVEFLLQTGRDPARDAFSVGRLLVAHTIREALADGLDRYDLGPGDALYKDRFATRQLGRDTFIVARGPSARTGRALLLGAHRIPPVKRRLRRALSA